MNTACIKRLVQRAFNGCIRAQAILAARYGILISTIL
jgi:hypothetical protein